MYKIFLLLSIFLAFLSSCNKQNVLKVDSTNIEDELDVNATLQLTFNDKVVPDSLIGLWSDTKYFDIQPLTEGTFKWTTNNKLIFIPKKSFLPASRYELKLNNNLLSYLEGYSLDSRSTFEFSTPLLEVYESRSYWDVSEDDSKPVLKVGLQFNYSVDPQKVLDHLTFSISNEEKKLTAETATAGTDLIFLVNDLEPDDEELKAQILLSKNMVAQNGTEGMRSDYKENLRIASPYQLNIIDIQTGHDGSSGNVTIRTTQAVKEQDLKEYITLFPKVFYKVEVFPDRFVITSDGFMMEQQYEVTLKKGLQGKIGGSLKNDVVQPLSFGEVEPSISFSDSKDFYVSGKGSRNIEVSILNVPEVNVKITKVYENNLVSFLQAYNSYYYDDYYDYYGGPDEGQLGDIVYEEKIQSINLASQGISKILALDFEDKLANHPGVYVIEIQDVSEYWRRAKKVVSISDIGIIAKKGLNQVTVFLNSIKTAQPLADVEVNFIGKNNQVTYSGKTDAEGVLIYEYDEFAAPGFEPHLITAKTANEFNVMALNRTRVNTSRFDVGGRYQNQSGLQAFIYGDRNLYRPGETLNITAIIRNYKWNSPGEIPVKVKINTPNGKTLKRLRKTLNKFGSFETNIPLLASAPTGYYSVQVFTTTDVLIGSASLKVEEFMPDRIKVKLDVDSKELKPGDKLTTSVKATNLFGPPAANRNYEVEVSTSRMGFYPKDYADYNFSLQGINHSFSNILRDGSTNSEGIATEVFDVPDEWKNMGVLQSSIYATVFDETGRPVNQISRVKIYSQDVFLGMKYNNYYNKTGQQVNFKLVAVDKEGKLLNNQSARLELVRHEYKTVLSRHGKYFRYRSEKVENILEKKDISITGTSTKFSFIPDLSGRYELRLYLPETSTYISQYIYAYGWGSTSYGSFEVNKEGQIDIELDKEKYDVGEKAKVLLKTPFEGKVLVTVESDKVLDHFYVKTDKRAASIELDLKAEYVPNVYISATLFKPHEKTDIPLTVAHGFKAVMVHNPANKMGVAITAPEKSRSGIKQTINVKAAPNSAVTIAAVDEGILQVGGYATPDPYSWFFRKRALEVNSYNIYPYLFPELGAIRSSSGGGMSEMEAGKRLNPMQNNRVKLVTFWSGILETDNKGNASFEIDIPQFSGSLRLMAVGYSQGDAFGYDKANMQVADPIVQSVALPRFLSPGDKVDVPVILTNTTDKSARAKTQIEISGPVELVGNSSESVEIAPGEEREVMFKLITSMSMGEAKVTVKTSALGEEFINETEMPVRPSSPLQKRSGAGVIKAGQTKQVDIDTKAFIESSADYKLIVSNNPLVQFSNSLDYLVRYPYGCVEQTVSSAFPQIYFSDLLGTVYINSRARSDAGNNVQKALDRIKLMQLYNGGLTYWPGSGHESWWGSVYAAHFVLEAKKAGYEVDDDFLDNLLKYLKVKLREKKLITYYYNTTKRKEIAPKEVAYSLYVLSMAGEKPTSLLNYYKANSHQLSLDSKYLLAGAFALSGDNKKYKEVVPNAFEGEQSVRTFSGSFNSYVRDEAIALNVMLEVDPDNAQVGIMARHVSESLRTRRYLNTQERSFGFLAMGKIARIAEQSDISGSVTADGKQLATFKNNTITLNTKKLKGKEIAIQTNGTGSLYYFWESEGITTDGSYLEEDSYLAVRKKIYNRRGQQVTTYNFNQNELLLVEISLKSIQGNRVENVAISDILPAGFEIENPRVTSLPPGMSFPNRKSYPTYTDVRDDRINMFVDATSNTKYYYYLVRCVSPGTFKMGPVGADAMYDGEYHSYSGGGEIIIGR